MNKGESTRRTILDQAMAAATELGLEALSIGSLAKRTGMSKSGLFAHFSSKENLQLAVLETASERFVKLVIEPAFKAPRGEPRVRAMLRKWMDWESAAFQPGGCVFISVANELADRPGVVRDYLVETQERWLATLARAAQIAIDEGHFRSNLDPQQFAFEVHGLVLSCHFYSRLLRSPDANDRLHQAFDNIILASRAS